MSIRRAPNAPVVLAVLLLVAGQAVAAAATGAERDPFTVGGIAVDVTAETATAARERAHAEGHVLALQKLLRRLLPGARWPQAPQPGAEEILGFVQDFSVADERTSDVRYLAELTFRFRPEPVRRLIRERGLEHAETVSKPVLVLPVYGARGAATLWGESNLWWLAWAGRAPSDGLVPLVVPLGDLGDLAAIDAERALAGDQAALAAIAGRYGTEDVLITQAVLLGDPEAGQARLQVGSSRLGRHAQQTVIHDHVQQPGETLQALLARAADVVDRHVQESWKQANLLRPGRQRWLTAAVPVTRLADWLEVKRRLDRVAAVRAVEVTAMSRRRTEVAIRFVGEEEQLVLAMAQSDLALSLYPGTGWELQLARGDAAPASEAAPTPAAPAATGSGRPPVPAGGPPPSAATAE